MSARPAPESGRMTVEEAIAAATKLHRHGHIDRARELYQAVVESAPERPEGWHFLGLLQYQDRQFTEGMAAVRRALDLAPDYADAHANLANMLIEQQDLAAAETHLARSLEIDPLAIPPRLAFAVLRKSQGRAAEAEALLAPALERDPDNPLLHRAMANALIAQRKLDLAVKHYWRAIELDPSIAESRHLLGIALAYAGRREEAARLIRAWLEETPDDSRLRHMLASCSGDDVPERASDDYVRTTFDAFASSFDAKLANLEYRAPELIAAAALRRLGPGRSALAVLDAGCGTGLMGPLIRPWCRSLEGVDLSQGMLARARQRGDYDRLVEGELTAFLRESPDRYDLVTCADTLCYFGAIEDAVNAAFAALRPGGWFLFSVEHAARQTGEFLLQFHGRYAHRRDYVESVVAGAGFTSTFIGEEAIRTENNRPVPGLIVAAQRGER